MKHYLREDFDDIGTDLPGSAQTPSEIERLRQFTREAVTELEDRKQEIYALRTQMNGRDALLKRCEDSLFNLLCFGVPDDRTEADKLIDELRTLSASAEPSAAVERSEWEAFYHTHMDLFGCYPRTDDKAPDFALSHANRWKLWQARAALERKP